ncbi:MAG: tol-pal system protein YbgF [Reyranella sp.]|uniref:tol-pal system protein YbgF n=1 Tax=Reyranella sp. TaxID=1929291 RepID=UPI001AC3AE73|nr:tol-pal system protein YbgF [Reyranella sp.]MBN9089124.1 tol-pal system protein YbgF [Reyranella sp.]
MKRFYSWVHSGALAAALLALPSAASAQRGDSVYIEDRMNQLQQTITMLTGQLEQLQYKNQQLQQQLEKMQTDHEFRLDQLEGKKGGAPRAPSVPPPPTGPNTAAAPPASGAQGEQLYHDAFKLLQDGDYAGAEKSFRTFVQRNPQHPLAGNAQYWLGETYYARRDYQNAMISFAEGYKVYKTSPKGPDNLLKLGITLGVLNKKQEACAVFVRFAQDYPRATDLQKRRADQERHRAGCG